MDILIWGIGEIKREFEGYLCDEVQIKGYIDSSNNNYVLNGRYVFSPADVFYENKVCFDYIVVANVFSNEIYELCQSFNADMKKIVFLRPLQYTQKVDDSLRNLNVLNVIAPEYVGIARREAGCHMGIDASEMTLTNSYPLYQWDYFRHRTFELIADTINGLVGDVAEAGVFKGFFSKLINAKFPDDNFYMFDTFEGFRDEEADKEKKAGHCSQDFIEIFKETSVEQVLQMMPHKEKCIVKQGFFPESAEGIDAVFKFVSIDFDFEESIYNALEWFYPRLTVGGYIFIHDYNEPLLVGVKSAVCQYEHKYGSLIKIPIADKCGSLIITKR